MAKSKSIWGMLLGAAITFSTVCAPGLANAAEVYFIRGFANVFSAGMNQMTNKLRARGVNAKALSNGQWRGVAADIIRRSKSGKVSYPIVIAGHSVGGQEAPRFSDALSKAGVKVALVIGVDPGFAPPAAIYCRFTPGGKLLDCRISQRKSLQVSWRISRFNQEHQYSLFFQC